MLASGLSPVSAHRVMYASCSVPTCALSSVASTPCSQLQYAWVIVIHTWRSSSAVNGSSGNGGAGVSPSHTHTMPPPSCTGWCSTGTLAAKASGFGA